MLPGGVQTSELHNYQARILKIQEAAMETVNYIFDYVPVKVVMFGRPKETQPTA